MKYLIIAGICIVAVFLGVLYFIPLGIEPLTEVYFENHAELPKNVFLNKNYNFSFTVHNLEEQKMGYNYSINSYDANNTLLFKIGEGDFALENNESKTFNAKYQFDEQFERAKIQVVIQKNKLETPWFEKKLWRPDPNYPYQIDIHFWVDEVVGTRIIITPD